MSDKGYLGLLLFLVFLFQGCRPVPTPANRSREGMVLWVLGEVRGRPPRPLEEILEPGLPPADIAPMRFIVWGEPPEEGTLSPHVRDNGVHGVWMEVQGRLYATDEATYRRYRPNCVRFALLEFSEDQAVVQIDTHLAPLAGAGEHIPLR